MLYLLVLQLLVAPGTYHNCPVKGDATGARTQALNLLKNRATVPVAFNPAITLEEMIKPFRDDRQRFKETDATEIVGYLVHVGPGGSESVNCHSTDPTYKDTHLELSTSPTGARPHVVVTEVTPRWREAMKSQGVDWSSTALMKLKGKKVAIRGWLMLDIEHISESENTHHPGSPANWRQTVWELHPVTSIQEVK